MTIAQSRGWLAARRSLHREVDRKALTLIRRLESLQTIPTDRSERPVPSVREILADLAALRQEFGRLDIDLRENRLSVVTEPIVLEGVPLGRFHIMVSLGQPGDRCAYEVEALDADVAARRSGITHPHVQDNQLCEGEGRAATMTVDFRAPFAGADPAAWDDEYQANVQSWDFMWLGHSARGLEFDWDWPDFDLSLSSEQQP